MKNATELAGIATEVEKLNQQVNSIFLSSKKDEKLAVQLLSSAIQLAERIPELEKLMESHMFSVEEETIINDLIIDLIINAEYLQYYLQNN